MRRFLFGLLVLVLGAVPARALPVSESAARHVALGTLRQHLALFGRWGGSREPAIGSVRPVVASGERIAYDITVEPSGHILVAGDDELAPVLLYSDVSRFDASRASDRRAIESWIVPEIDRDLRRVRDRAKTRSAGTRPDRWSEGQAGRAWLRLAPEVAGQTGPAQTGQAGGAPSPTASVVGPLLTSAWSQSPYYNNYTPYDGLCQTVTGCTATATGQLMRYWQWPPSGVGSHSYVWTRPSDKQEQVLSASFEHPYNWAAMTDSLSYASPPAAVDAIARLLADVGFAIDMGYGCGASGGSDYLAATVALPSFFRYKPSTGEYSRVDHTAAEFFAQIQVDLDASPRRPLLFVVWSVESSPGIRDAGHALVIDGYQTFACEPSQVHLNLGWGGYQQGWYTIDTNWTAGGYNWDASYQWVYPGIEPLPASCTFRLGDASKSVPAIGGSFSFTIEAGSNCPWIAHEASQTTWWFWITNGQQGQGNGTVNYYVTENPGPSPRVSTITAGGQTFTIVQAGTTSPPVFTDDPLRAGTSQPRAVHVTELRQRINELRSRHGLAAAAWTDPTLPAGSVPVKAIHLIELRAALDAVYTAAGRTPPTYFHALTAGQSTIRAEDIAELRGAVIGAW